MRGAFFKCPVLHGGGYNVRKLEREGQIACYALSEFGVAVGPYAGLHFFVVEYHIAEIFQCVNHLGVLPKNNYARIILYAKNLVNEMKKFFSFCAKKIGF